MNTNSPLVPQGSLIDQKPRQKSNVYIAVFAIIGLHVMVLGALLLQGCKDRPAAVTANTETNNLGAMPPLPPPTNNNLGAIDTFAPLTPTNPVLTSVPPMPPALGTLTPATPALETPAATPTGGTEYVVAKNDSFSTISKKTHISVAAIEKANPGVDSKKLKVGQKLVIPEHASTATAATTPTTATTTLTGSAPLAPASGVAMSDYKVKPGDNLTKIASANKVSVKELKALNNLKTDRIQVNQSLKLPTKAAATDAAPALSAPVTVPVHTASR